MRKYEDIQEDLRKNLNNICSCFVAMLAFSLISGAGLIFKPNEQLLIIDCILTMISGCLSIGFGLMLRHNSIKNKALKNELKQSKPDYDDRIRESHIFKEKIQDCISKEMFFIKSNEQIVFVLDNKYFACQLLEKQVHRVVQMNTDGKVIKEISNEYVKNLFMAGSKSAISNIHKRNIDKKFSNFIEEISESLQPKESFENEDKWSISHSNIEGNKKHEV